MASLTLALLTGLLILRGPQTQNVTLIAQGPSGNDAPTSAVISVTFSRPVDQTSAEESFVMTPVVAGAFAWQDNTLAFRPSQPLAANTAYRVTIRSGLRDAQGRPNRGEVSWPFRTRGPQLLVLGSAPDGASILTRVAPDGGSPLTLLTTPERIIGVTAAPDGAEAILVVLRGPQRTGLIIVNLSDGITRPLVDDPEASAGEPSWSISQDFIAYVRRPILGDTLGQARIWLAQPDGTPYGPLLNSENLGFAPVWSPDGSDLAFVTGASSDMGIYQFFSDSLRTFAAGTGDPATWAPDGSAVAYTATVAGQPGAPLAIRRWDLAQDRSSDLTDGTASDHSPAWSPQGGQIAFVRQASAAALSGIWLMAPDGTGQRQLTTSGQDVQPTWAPDGQQIAFVRQGGAQGVSEVWVVDVATGEARMVMADATHALWMP